MADNWPQLFSSDQENAMCMYVGTYMKSKSDKAVKQVAQMRKHKDLA